MFFGVGVSFMHWDFSCRSWRRIVELYWRHLFPVNLQPQGTGSSEASGEPCPPEGTAPWHSLRQRCSAASDTHNGEELHLLLLFHRQHTMRSKTGVYFYIFITFPTPLLLHWRHFPPPALRPGWPHRDAYAQEGRDTVAMATLHPNFLASMHIRY